MKWKTLFLSLAIGLFSGSMAWAQDPPVTYTLTVEVTPFGHGTVSLSSDGPYASGTEVTLTPTASSGYTFIGWNDGWVDPTTGLSTTHRVVTITSDTTLVAVFSGSGIVIHGSVFGGGEGTNATVAQDARVYMKNGLVETNLYGGGALAQVEGNTTVTMSGGEVGVLEYLYKHGNTTHMAFDSVRHVNDGGRVFGGGKGDESDYDLGRVEGNATVALSGGHVQYNVYGGGEMGSVGLRTLNYATPNDPTTALVGTTPVDGTGLATITVTGGQVGPAPKPSSTNSGYDLDIALDGTDGYVFGGGKGKGDDPLNTYKLFADVNSTSVTIQIPTNANTMENRIWGSVFGGAEDGHVLGDAYVYYYNGLTGTIGTTSYDGNIFGGGRNYSRKNYTAGRVQGNVHVTMTNGQLYGSIFGGGRLALTGVGVNGFYQRTDGRYGAMLDGADHGNITVQVQGGTVGNQDTIAHFTAYSMGDVYGGGKGHMGGIDVPGHPAESPLLISLCKNTDVQISGTARILGSVFGGGEVANVGNYTWQMPNPTTIQNIGITSDGLAKVTVSGGTIGIDNMQMNCEIAGTAGDHNYNLKYNYDLGHVFGGGEGLFNDPASYNTINPGNEGHNNVSLIDLMATVDTTSVTITGNAFVKGSVYGGAENGHVLDGTYVRIEGGQIGCGEGLNDPYSDSPGNNQFINPLTTTVTSGTGGNALAECPHWDYDPNTNYPFDPILIKDEGKTPSDGRTYFGNVFGGGSGYYPYIKYNTTSGQYETHWNPKSGIVEGNTKVEIEGGHILTSVYGGCEVTDVLGSATVIMSGGTLGVPRTDDQMHLHPVTCYLFGAGKGDSRVYFNQWTNVASTNVQVSGGTIYGSVFGGGEEGHVLGDAVTSISQPSGKTTIIGTSGTSYVDGNVFGGGRGFSGEALTAGVVVGDVSLTISGGTMLGSIYGGGRLASVGTYLVQPENPLYGKMQPDKTNERHGHITLNISGGTIGNDAEAVFQDKTHSYGGNVYGGSMGRLELLNGDPNPIWPYLAKVKDTHITISQTATRGTTIKGNVYGGGELGTVTTDSNHLDTIPLASTSVTVQGGTIWGNVFGGSYGSDKNTDAYAANITLTLPGQTTATTYAVTPMKHAGNVFGNTNVYLQGGWVKKNIYGGGEFASVGFITSATEHPATGANIHPFNLSWPCEFTYAAGTGEATVSVTGGRLGITGEDFIGPWILDGTEYKPAHNGQAIVYSSIDDLEDYEQDNGDIYGGGKGVAGDRFEMAYLANVKKATVTITYPETLPPGQTAASPTNFKPKDDIIVPISNMEDWSDYTSIPCVVGAVYGGGENGHTNEDTWITLNRGLVGHAVYGGGKGKDKYETSSKGKDYSYTAGKVYGNTHVTINGGNVVRSVFGGGNLASVGKGNYNRDSYNTTGMGESTTDTDLLAIAAASGHTYVNIYNGTLGMLKHSAPHEVFKDTIPYGSVFGGCRGKVDAALNNTNSVLSHLGFVNYTHVTIGGTTAAQSPRLYGSVYGGAQDGFVRHHTDVLVRRGEIGVAYVDASTALSTVGDDDITSANWTDRGNVYGGGSGKGTYKDGSNKLYSPNAGAVIEYSKVTINGGTIHRNVYGGGNLAKVGPDVINGTDCTKEYSCDTVDINYAVGIATDVAQGYGGNVFGACRGRLSISTDPDYTDPETFSKTVYTLVNINAGADVKGNVYGGGELGQVRQSTDVNINAGTVQGNVFGSGKGNDAANAYGCVKVDTDVTMEDGQVKGSVYGGGQVASVGTYSDVGGGVIGCAENTGTATVTVTGGTVGSDNLYGETNGTYQTVASYYNHYEPAITDKGHVFGGGKGESDNSHNLLCDVNTTQVTIGTSGQNTGGPRIYGSVYGGAVDGHVLGNTDVTFHSGTIGKYGLSSWDGHIFGGGQGSGYKADDNTPFVLYTHCGRVGGNPTITMDGGTLLGSIYGGGRLALTGVNQNGVYSDDNTKGNVTINVSGGTLGNHVGDGHDLLESDFSVGDIFGSGRGDVEYYESIEAGCVTNVEINVSDNPTIYGSVFGGGEMASLGYRDSNNEFKTGTGHAEITIEDSPIIGTAYEYTIGEDDNPGQWTIYNEDGTLFHTCTGNVFGGCQGDVDLSSEKWVSMGSSKSANVTINGGTIRSGVFGGPEQGTMLGDAHVIIEQTDNTKPILIGTVVNEGETNEYLFGHVFGGGYGSDDPADNSTTYVPDPENHPGVTAPVVHDSIAVREALDLPWTADYFAGRVYGDVSVKLLGGTIQGDVYGGGGLAYVGYEPSATKGNATLDIGLVNPENHQDTIGSATILGNVYGANNLMGSPLGNINVKIYKTAHTAANLFSGTTYAIHQVFGGGNHANYTPTPVSKTNGATTVHVYNCNNTIEEVYGGGNAADVGVLDSDPNTTGNQTIQANTHLIIDGGRIDRVFGGGNGPDPLTPANIYGTAYTDVYGGTIQQLFGGSNMNGSITETNMIVDASKSKCDSDIKEIYGGSNEGDIDGNITTTIACGDGKYTEIYGGALNANIGGNVTLNVYGNEIGTVYGGSWGKTQTANIGGNVNLNLYGGTITTAYGGSNNLGNVAGVITVNVLDFETQYCTLDITNLYGAGNQATHNTTANNTVKNSPVVNVMHIAQAEGIKGNVFGGGMGIIGDLTRGAVTANPFVNIGYDATTQSGLLPQGYPSTSQLTAFPHAVVSGHVHGGGDIAPTTGNTTVNIRENSTLVETNVFGGGHGNVANADAAKITGNTLVNMTAGTVKGNIYGGGEEASVCSNSSSNKDLGIAKVTISGGTVGDVDVTGQGPEILGDVYGGGLGKAGDSFRDWGNVDSTQVEISGTAYIVNSVFGGAEDGHVERNTNVVVSGGTIGKPLTLQERMLNENGQVTTYVYTGNVLGGGRGIATDANGQYNEITGRVFGNTNVTVSGGVVRHSVYGGGGLATIGTYTKNTDGRFEFTEGTGKATVTVNGTALIGPKASDLSGSDQNDNYKYLGCNEGDVYGSGCGLPGDEFADYAFTDSTLVTIGGGAQVTGNVFGGGENGYVETEAKVVVEENAVIGGIPLHGTSYTVSGGEYDGVTVSLNTADDELAEDDYGIGRTIYRGNVFGGGRGSEYINTNHDYSLTAGRVYGHTHVTIQGNAKVYNRVYGGGAIASVGDFNYDNTVTDSITSIKNDGVTEVFVQGEAIIGSDNGHNCGEVYGGGKGLVGALGSQLVHLAYVGNANVTVSGTPQILSNVYGGSANGHVQEDARVTIGGTPTIGVANQSSWHGNVYGGGGGGTRYKMANDQLHHSISSGRVFGDTYVEINSGTIRNNVYGGGAFASVGSYNIYASDPSGYVIGNTGNTTVTIKGGSMKNVFGSGKGSVSDPAVYQFFDSLTYAVRTTVEIGPNNTNPTVSGSVYGSGENGHVFEQTTVHVHSGTVTGSVYGAGKGTDYYGNDPANTNPLSGVVQGNTEVQVYTDATVGYNVYGGGENGQVFGVTDVHIRGGNIGTDGTDNGNVYGASKGLANLSYDVNNANIGGSTTVTLHSGTIKGSLFGGGENGSVRFGETDAVASTVNVEGGTVNGSVYGGGQMGFTTGNTVVNMTDGTVENHVFGGAYGATNQVYVKGLRMVNMRGGYVKGNVYGGSFNADDAIDGFHTYNSSTWNSYGGTTQACVVNYSGGHTEHNVFGAGYRGRTYGSSYVFVGYNAIMNAPNHTATTGENDPYNGTFYNNHQGLVIDRDVWAGADYGEFGGTFGNATLSGRSDIYIDGDGYDTESEIQNDNRYMILRNSVFGCGTLNDGGARGKRIMIRNYGHAIASGSTDPEPWAGATRTIHSIQYADSLIIENSHIHLKGRGIVEQQNVTEEYALHHIIDSVRIVNGSSLFIDKPVSDISNLISNIGTDLYGTPSYTEVNYDQLNDDDDPTNDQYNNKIRINKGTYLSVTKYDSNNNKYLYGALKGFFYLMTDGPYNAFAYARPKQSDENGNHITDNSHNYPHDGGFVSYQPALNIYDVNGGLAAETNDPAVQMRYENHTPNQRGYDDYFRVWRFTEQGGLSSFDVVLHAIAKPEPENANRFSWDRVSLNLPAQSGAGSYYRFKKMDGGLLPDINYGSELKTVTAGFQETGDNLNNLKWMYYYKKNVNEKGFVYDVSSSHDSLTAGQTFMTNFPNNAFGLTVIPTGGFNGGTNNQPWLLCPEADAHLATLQWNTNDPSMLPQIDFVLTHSNNIDGNFNWDPLSLKLEQVKSDNTVNDEVTVNVTIITSTTLEQTNKVKAYAMMTGAGNGQDIYKARVVIPAYTLSDPNKHSKWTLTSVEWVPESGFTSGTLVEGQPAAASPALNPTSNYVGMTMYRALNFDNVNGWWNNNTPNPTHTDLGSKVGTGLSIELGETEATNPMSFDFDLLYDGHINVGVDGNAKMGTVKVKALVTNYVNGPGENGEIEVNFEIEVLRRGKGKGFYIDGVHGDFMASGHYPDAAQPSLGGILHFARDYEPVDSIYIVNKVTADAVNNLEWSTPFTYMKIFRYNGGHPLSKDVEPSNWHYTDYLTTYPNNPAYMGPLVDVKTSMSISSAIIDGAYELKEMNGHYIDPTNSNTIAEHQEAEHVIAHAPLINILEGATLTIDGVSGESKLLYNYNDSGNGGAINIAPTGTLKINQNTSLVHNYVKDGDGIEHHGGGVYMGEYSHLLVSDDVMVKDNQHVSFSKATTAENVYIPHYNTVINVGTEELKDTYGALNPTSEIHVTKDVWDGKNYTPVVYAENTDHLSNLIGQTIVFDEIDPHRYRLLEYPDRYSNGDPYRFDKLYFVKTWTNQVMSTSDIPDTYDSQDIDTPEELAWAISIANGLNGQSATPAEDFKLTKDIDMSAYYWVPIGTKTTPYTGTFDGDGYAVTGICSPYASPNLGMFGNTDGATIQNLQAKVELYSNGNVDYIGGIVGNMHNGVLKNCESAGYLRGGSNTHSIGGLVGKTEGTTLIHSSFATDTLHTVTDATVLGGLVGDNSGSLYNSFSNFVVNNEGSADTIGGLVGINRDSGHVENCYSFVEDGISSIVYYNQAAEGNIQYCYSNSDSYKKYGTDPKYHGTYDEVKDRKAIGYMYDDNLVELEGGGTTDYVPSGISYINHHEIVWPGLLNALNQWVKQKNAITILTSPYYHKNFSPWYRPTTTDINGDLPVLGFPEDSTIAVIDTVSSFLRYSKDFDLLLDTCNKLDRNTALFLYGNATEVDKVPGSKVNVYVNEDAVLMQADGAGDFTNTTVGVTFDNSKGSQTVQNNNIGSYELNYDWHMLSSPLSNAPLGVYYDDTKPSYHGSPSDDTLVDGSYLPHLEQNQTEVFWDLYSYHEPHYHWINLKRKSGNHWHYEYPHHYIPYKGDPNGNPEENENRFVPGKGYMMAISQDSYLSNTGTLNKTVTYPITFEAPVNVDGIPSYNKGTNLVGNPYQAYLDLTLVTDGNGGLEEFYIYDADQRTYAPFTGSASTNPCIPSQYIHPHQGFIVLTKENRVMTFTPSMAGTTKSDKGHSYFRKKKVNYPVVNLFAENEDGDCELAIVELGRPELGGVEKADNLRNANFKLYTRMEGNNYGLLFAPVSATRIPLFFKTEEDGNYTLRWNTHNGTYSKLILIDNITGVQYDMLAHDKYEFVARATDYAARFYIVFSVIGVTEIDNAGTEDFAYYDGTNWVIEGKGQLDLIDVTGRVLRTFNLSGDQSRISLEHFAAGTYMLRLVTNNKYVKAQKIVIY